MTQGLKAVDTKPDNQGPKWWEERPPYEHSPQNYIFKYIMPLHQLTFNTEKYKQCELSSGSIYPHLSLRD